MKKIAIFLSLATFSAFGQSQVDSLGFFESLWPTLAPFDSVTYSNDSGANFNADEVLSMRLFANGEIDTATIFENGVPILGYRGALVSPDTTEVLEFDLAQSPQTAIGRYEHVDNASFQDSMTLYYNLASGSPALPIQELTFVLDGLDRLSELKVRAQFGSGLTPVANIRYYYNNQGILDSANQFSPEFNAIFQVYEYYYSDTVLNQFEILELNQNTGEFELFLRYDFVNNANGKIIQATESEFDPNIGNLRLRKVMRLDRRKNSNLSLSKNDIEKLSIFPNPARNFLYIKNTQNSEYEIHTILGQKVKSGNVSEKIDVRDLRSGIYVLTMGKNGQKVSHKFIKK